MKEKYVILILKEISDALHNYGSDFLKESNETTPELKKEREQKLGKFFMIMRSFSEHAMSDNFKFTEKQLKELVELIKVNLNDFSTYVTNEIDFKKLQELTKPSNMN